MNNVKMTEPIKRAVAWIAEERLDKPTKSLTTLLDEAAMRFNLGPQDWQFLRRFFANDPSSEHSTS
jgi:hypothetical protein